MTTAETIAADFRRGAILVTLGLSAFVCLALFVRARLPLLSVRAVTTLMIVCALLASPALVSIAAGPLPKLGQFVGIRVDPSLAIQWGPAVIAAAVGLAYSIVVLKRFSRRVLVPLAVFLMLYGLTWWPGVPAVRAQLRDAHVVYLKVRFREMVKGSRWELRPDEIDRQAEAVNVEVHRAIPIWPALMWVSYSDLPPVGPSTSYRRLVAWYGLGSRILEFDADAAADKLANRVLATTFEAGVRAPADRQDFIADAPVRTWLLWCTSLVAIALAAITILALWARSRLPSPLARAGSLVILTLAILLSGPLVDRLVHVQLAGWERANDVFVCLFVGHIVWAPALLSVIVGGITSVALRSRVGHVPAA